MSESRSIRLAAAPRRLRRLAVGGAALGVVIAGCSSDDQAELQQDVEDVATSLADVATTITDAAGEVSQDAVEAAVRSFASQQAAQELDDLGHPLDGELDCSADAAASLTEVAVDCTGMTSDGEPVEVSGTTSELPGVSFDQLDGSFTISVGGEELLQTDALG